MIARFKPVTIARALAAAGVVAAGLASGTAAAGDAGPDAGPLGRPGRRAAVHVQAELVETVPTPTPAEVSPYTEALVVYRYRVLKTKRAGLEGKEIYVTHWGLWRNIEQRVARHRPGKRMRLKLCPFEEVEDALQTVYVRRPAGALEGARGDLPRFHDLGQKLDLPPEERARWGYGVDLSEMMPLFFHLKDQVRLVALGDCQAWFANKTPLFMQPENGRTPVAISMCQQRSGLPFQKLLVDRYLVRLPRLEWVVLTWNPRFVSGAWTEHGVKAGQFAGSAGFKYDREHADEVWKPREGGPVTVEEVARSPRFMRVWEWRPWGWIYLAPDRHRFNPRGEVLKAQKHLGAYAFVPERWAIFESIVETLAARNVKLLVYTTPVHPESARQRVKDKTGVDAAAYRDQVARMRALERRYPKHFFFYDLNNMGDNGLVDADFENIDHVSASGAEKVGRRVEAFRRKAEAELAAAE